MVRAFHFFPISLSCLSPPALLFHSLLLSTHTRFLLLPQSLEGPGLSEGLEGPGVPFPGLSHFLTLQIPGKESIEMTWLARSEGRH